MSQRAAPTPTSPSEDPLPTEPFRLTASRPTTLPRELSDQQMTLLREIAGPYLTGQGWPIWDYVLQQMEVEHDLDASKVISSLPRVGAQGTLGASYGFTTASDWRMIRDDETVQLTVAAALLIPELRPELAKPFLQVLGHMVTLQRSARPSPTEITSVWLDSQELTRSIPLLDPGFVAALPQILNGEPVTRGGNSSGPNPPQDLSWRKQIKREIKQYAGVNSLVGYVDKTCEIVEAQAEESRRLHRGNAVIAGDVTISTPSDRLPVPDHGPVVTVPQDGPVAREEVASKAEPGPFIEPGLIEDLKESGAKIPWAMDKLIDFCRGLNGAVADENPHVAIPLVRMIMDHVPPGFDRKTFAQVAEHPVWGLTDKRYMKALTDSRLLGDDVVHRQLRKSDSRITMTELQPMKAWVNALLQGLLEVFHQKIADRPNQTYEVANAVRQAGPVD